MASGHSIMARGFEICAANVCPVSVVEHDQIQDHTLGCRLLPTGWCWFVFDAKKKKGSSARSRRVWLSEKIVNYLQKPRKHDERGNCLVLVWAILGFVLVLAFLGLDFLFVFGLAVGEFRKMFLSIQQLSVLVFGFGFGNCLVL